MNLTQTALQKKLATTGFEGASNFITLEGNWIKSGGIFRTFYDYRKQQETTITDKKDFISALKYSSQG